MRKALLIKLLILLTVSHPAQVPTCSPRLQTLHIQPHSIEKTRNSGKTGELG